MLLGAVQHSSDSEAMSLERYGDDRSFHDLPFFGGMWTRKA